MPKKSNTSQSYIQNLTSIQELIHYCIKKNIEEVKDIELFAKQIMDKMPKIIQAYDIVIIACYSLNYAAYNLQDKQKSYQILSKILELDFYRQKDGSLILDYFVNSTVSRAIIKTMTIDFILFTLSNILLNKQLINEPVHKGRFWKLLKLFLDKHSVARVSTSFEKFLVLALKIKNNSGYKDIGNFINSELGQWIEKNKHKKGALYTSIISQYKEYKNNKNKAETEILKYFNNIFLQDNFTPNDIGDNSNWVYEKPEDYQVSNSLNSAETICVEDDDIEMADNSSVLNVPLVYCPSIATMPLMPSVQQQNSLAYYYPTSIDNEVNKISSSWAKRIMSSPPQDLPSGFQKPSSWSQRDSDSKLLSRMFEKYVSEKCPKF